MRIRSMVWLTGCLLSGGAVAQQPVGPTAETASVLVGGNTRNGVALRVHPTEPSRSLVLLTDSGGLLSFGLDGRLLSTADQSQNATSVDVRDGFPFLAGASSLVALANTNALRFYRVVDTPDAGSALALIPAQSTTTSATLTVALYRSPTSGKFYVLVGDGTGEYQQREVQVQQDGTLLVAATPLRTLDVQTPSAVAAADDAEAALFIGDDEGRLWRFGAEPDSGDAGVLVAQPADGGLSAQPVTGLGVYRLAGSSGFLVASNSGDGRFTVLDRAQPHAVRGSFTLVRDGGVDDVVGARALALSSSPLLPGFAGGLLVAHDPLNEGGAENAKLVAWNSVSQAFAPPLDSSTPDAGDGGTQNGDGGTPGGGGILPPGGGGSLPPGDDDDGPACSCASSSVPGAALLGLVAVLLRRRRQGR